MSARPHFGAKKRTKADHAAALATLLITRTKPYTEREIQSVARIHWTTDEAVKAKLRELGKGALIGEAASVVG